MRLNPSHLYAGVLRKPYKKDTKMTVHAIHVNHCNSILSYIEISQVSAYKIEAQRFNFPNVLEWNYTNSAANIQIIFETCKFFRKKS